LLENVAFKKWADRHGNTPRVTRKSCHE
jgi:hypothetical protein